MTSQELDLALIAFFAVLAIIGWRRGLIVSLLSFVGMILGAIVAREMVSTISDQGMLHGMSVGLFAVVAIVLISFGSSVGAFLGRRIRNATSWKPIQVLDSAGGSVISLAIWSVITWIVASLVLAMPVSQATSLAGNSIVIADCPLEIPMTNGHQSALPKSLSPASPRPGTMKPTSFRPSSIAPRTR